MIPSKYWLSILATEVNAWMDSLARASEGAPFGQQRDCSGRLIGGWDNGKASWLANPMRSRWEILTYLIICTCSLNIRGLDPYIYIYHYEGLLLYPVAVCAPTGHKEGSSRDDVLLMSSLLSHPIAPNTIMSLPVCFHITKKTNLRSIWREGLIPGGLGEGHRMFTFFNPYVPWDHRSWTVTKSVDTRNGGYICLYIPTETLMVEYGGYYEKSPFSIGKSTINCHFQ